MNNILLNTDNVNTIKLFDFFYKRLKNRPYWNKTEDGYNVPFCYGIGRKSTPQLIDKQLFFNIDEEKTHKSNGDIYKRLSFVREALEKTDLQDSQLIKATKMCAEKLLMLQVRSSNGKCSWFEGMAKGTKRYNTIQQGKILDFVSMHSLNKYDTAFLTLTCDIKQYKNRADAWENYLSKEFYPIMENLRKHYEAEYVATMESTSKGYPHIHIILFIPKGTFKELSKLKNKQKIRFGKLYNIVKNNITSPVFCLEKADGKNLKWYLTKYIKKGIEEDVFSILTKEEELTKSQRKLLKEFIYLKAFRKRKVLMTRKGKKKDNKKEIELQKASVSVAIKEDQENWSVTKSRDYLTSICNNSPLGISKTINSMSFRTFIESFESSPQRIQNVPDELANYFEKKGTFIHNTRNFISDFVLFIQDWENSPLNRRTYWADKKNNNSKLCDGYNFNNDEEWLECITMVFDFYCTKVLVEYNDYADVLRGKENLSLCKKTWNFKGKFGKWTTIEMQEDKESENYYNYEENKIRRSINHKGLQKSIEINLEKERELLNNIS
jgi:hypothetical protein